MTDFFAGRRDDGSRHRRLRPERDPGNGVERVDVGHLHQDVALLEPGPAESDSGSTAAENPVQGRTQLKIVFIPVFIEELILVSF